MLDLKNGDLGWKFWNLNMNKNKPGAFIESWIFFQDYFLHISLAETGLSIEQTKKFKEQL